MKSTSRKSSPLALLILFLGAAFFPACNTTNKEAIIPPQLQTNLDELQAKEDKAVVYLTQFKTKFHSGTPEYTQANLLYTEARLSVDNFINTLQRTLNSRQKAVSLEEFEPLVQEVDDRYVKLMNFLGEKNKATDERFILSLISPAVNLVSYVLKLNKEERAEMIAKINEELEAKRWAPYDSIW